MKPEDYDFPEWMREALVGYCHSRGLGSSYWLAFIRNDSTFLVKAMEEMAGRLLAERDNLRRVLDHENQLEQERLEQGKGISHGR